MNKNFQFLIFNFQFLLVACSTVSHLPADELLYIGTKAVTVSDDTHGPLQTQAVGEAKVAFVSPPNNALFGSSRYRVPFPVGLWAYNAFVDDSTKLHRWLFRAFATQPIYISTVNPSLRADVAENTLRNYGYFGSNVSYKVDTLPDGRKAKLSYNLQLGEAWCYGEVEYLGFAPAMDSLIRATWSQRLLRQGEQLSYTSLSDERNRLFMLFREHGYYYYRPEMIVLLADTTRHKGEADIRVTTPKALPSHVTTPWHMGHTYLTLRHTIDETVTDTLTNGAITYLYHAKRIPLRQALLVSRITYQQGNLYSSTAQNTTQRDLNRLGIFSNVGISCVPHDSTRTADTLDIYINTLLELPYELSLEANLTAKSNEQVGPGIVASLSRRNLLRMADIIQLRLKGDYEWQTDNTEDNSFELGADLSVSVPLLLVPGGYDRPYERPVSTTARLYGDWIHHGGYFRMLAFGGNLTYAFSTSDVLTHNITPIKLTFNTLEHTTQRFDSIMTANPTIGLSFHDQFVPSSSYTLTYDNVNHAPHHPSRVTLSLTSAGALASLIYACIGHPFSERGKSLLGTPYTQFIKGYAEACRYYRLAPRHTLATRLIAGAIYPYGNTAESAPFSELFHVGGANDIRAFPLRSIGPGSYHTTGHYAYIDHTGNIKLEANVEWRFPLAGRLYGALFVDAGNVWLTHDDTTRPGGQLRWSTFAHDIALGTGIGMRYDLRILLLRCDIGIPIHIPYNIDKTGYYNVPHFGRGLCLHLGVGYPF